MANINKLITMATALTLFAVSAGCSSQKTSSNNETPSASNTTTKAGTITLPETSEEITEEAPLLPSETLTPSEIENLEGMIITLADYKKEAKDLYDQFAFNLPDADIEDWIEAQKESIYLPEMITDRPIEPEDAVNVDALITNADTGDVIYDDKYITLNTSVSLSVFPEIPKSLTGKKAGEEYSLTSTLEGVPVDIKITINFIEGSQEVQDIDEATYCRVLSNKTCSTHEELMSYARKEVFSEMVKQYRYIYADNLLGATTFDEEKLKPYLDKKVEEGLEYYKEYAGLYGLDDMSSLAETLDTTEEEITATIKENAERHLKQSLIVYEIMRREEIVITDEDMENAADAVVKSYKFSSLIEYLDNYSPEELREDIIGNIVFSKVAPINDVPTE